MARRLNEPMSIVVPTDVMDGASADNGVGGYVVLAVTFTTAVSESALPSSSITLSVTL